MVDSLFQDVVFALRTLRRAPVLTLTIVVTVALAIGGATAIFSAVNAIVLRPLPYADAHRLVTIWQGARDAPLAGAVSPVDLADWRVRSQAFEGIGAIQGWRATLGGVEVAESLAGVFVSPEVLELLRVSPLHGRRFDAADGVPGAPRRVMLGHGLWVRQFGSDPEVVGSSIVLNDLDWQVIGILPESFQMPRRPATEVLAAWARDPSEWSRGSRVLSTIARLRPGIDLTQANADLDRVSAALAQDHPDSNDDVLAWAQDLHQATVGGVTPYLYLLLGGVSLVLLIAVANVANLLVARASARGDEMAVRVALGARTGRVARQLLTEAMLLAVVGGLLGAVLGDLGVRSLATLAPSAVPRLTEVRVDSTVLLFGLAMTGVTGLLFGLAPVLHARRADIGGALRGTRGGSAVTGLAARRALVATQVAIALTLLIGSGLLLNSLGRLLSADPGFDAEGVVSARVRLGARYDGSDNHERFFTTLLERLRAAPGVAEAGAVFLRPFGAGNVSGLFSIIGREVPDDGDSPEGSIQSVSHDFFRLLRMPMRAGRAFEPRDGPHGERVAIVNETAARLYWPGEDPVGQRIRLRVSLDDQDPDRERLVVGVVADASRRALGEVRDPFVFVPYRQYPTQSLYVLLRGNDGIDGLVPTLRATVRDLDPGIPVYAIRNLAELIDDSVATDRFAAVLLGAFAVIALTLGAVGIYGVIAYAVTERTGEIGIRMALGAQRGDVLRLVMRDTALLVGTGMLVGILVSSWLTAWLEGMLHEVSTTDPATFASMVALLAATALVASWLPARRAARVDPVRALRNE